MLYLLEIFKQGQVAPLGLEHPFCCSSRNRRIYCKTASLYLFHDVWYFEAALKSTRMPHDINTYCRDWNWNCKFNYLGYKNNATYGNHRFFVYWIKGIVDHITALTDTYILKPSVKISKVLYVKLTAKKKQQ